MLKSAFITSSITSGIGASSISVIGKPSFKEVKIITVREGEDIRDTSIVPKKWYDEVVKSRKAYEKLIKIYDGSAVVKSIGRSVKRDKTIGGYSRPCLQVYLDDFDSGLNIPNELYDIDIQESRHEEGQLDCEEDYHRTTDPLKGGLAGGGDESGFL